MTMRILLTRFMLASLLLWLPASLTLAMGMAYAQPQAACTASHIEHSHHDHHAHHACKTESASHSHDSCHSCALCVIGLAGVPQLASLPLMPEGGCNLSYADYPARFITEPLEHPPRA